MYDLIYSWKNNEKRKTLYGRKCRIIKYLSKNSYIIEFLNGQREVVSRYSVKKPCSKNKHSISKSKQIDLNLKG